MKQTATKIAAYLLDNTLWVFVAGILFTSMVITVNMDDQTWGRYLGLAVKLALYYSPALLFALFRNRLERTLSLPLLAGLWLFIFILLPSLMNNMEVYEIWNLEQYAEILAIMGAVVIASSEIAIQISRFSDSSNALNIGWLRKVSLEKSILLFLLAFAVFYIGIGWRPNFGPLTLATFPSFLFVVLQLFLILLLYYVFYWINHYVLVNQLWKKRGVFYYLLGFGATLIFLYPVVSQLIYWLPIGHETEIHPVNSGKIFEEMNWLVPLAGMVLSIPFILSVNWLRQSKAYEEMEKQKSETELSLLKQQINPHFFFNTLNNLYALSITKDEQTPEVILQLSELMRYTIYKGKEEEVNLQEEVKYLEDYVKLQQIRLHKNLDFRFEKSIADAGIAIPPLLFINLVENAFKHGIEPAEKEAFLHLKMEANEQQLTFTCTNSVEELSKEKGGTGLTNLRRRLELRFPERHELRTFGDEESYRAVLSISFG